MTPAEIWHVCNTCAAEVFDHTRPTPGLALNIARLLFGTAAVESAFEHTRQTSVIWDSQIGGFSHWQLECESIRTSIADLKARPQLLEHATAYMYGTPRAPLTWIMRLPFNSLLWAMTVADTPRLGATFARLHYRRIQQPIPTTLEGHATYWKKVYNTMRGAGTINRYLACWEQHCAAIAGRF